MEQTQQSMEEVIEALQRENADLKAQIADMTTSIAHPAETAGSIQWHPGLYSATELELRENKDDLIFETELQLTKGPLFMDMMLIKKISDVEIKNEIGRIFRKYNVWEFKSPDDELGIDEFFKTYAYACLYKSGGKTADEIPDSEITVTLFRHRCPDGLFKSLEKKCYTIHEKYRGVYYIEKGSETPLFPTQIIVGSRFDKLTHESFRILSGNADEGDVKKFIDKALRETDPDEQRKIDSILQVSVSANKELYARIKEGDERMCQAMRELMKDEIAEERQDQEQETLLISIKNVMESFGVTIEKAMESLKIPQDMWPMYTSMIQK